MNLIYGNNEAECDPEQRNVTTVSLDLYKVSLSDNFLLLCERVTVHYLRLVTRSCHIFHTPQRISDVCQLRGKFKSPVVTVDTWFKNTKDTAVLDLVFIERLIEILSRLAFFCTFNGVERQTAVFVFSWSHWSHLWTPILLSSHNDVQQKIKEFLNIAEEYIICYQFYLFCVMKQFFFLLNQECVWKWQTWRLGFFSQKRLNWDIFEPRFSRLRV